ncbi:MAG TPA: F-box-like domain-containing protein [Rhabdochlamydiaceae bacterium]|nr:F-box-like domain-containing protein [Rhabdochlamydiaceae bacterium]
MRENEFDLVLSFMEPKDLVCSEKVCRSWNKFIKATEQWKKQCQKRLNLPNHIDPNNFLPEKWNYKLGAWFGSPKVFDAKIYRDYLGADVGIVPPIPKKIALERSVEPDPCDDNKKIGQNYVWLYRPKSFKISSDVFYLDKPEDPNEEDAPLIVKKEDGKFDQMEVLEVYNTISNVEKLFKNPRKGKSLGYEYIHSDVVYYHGSKRSTSEWICMREDVIGKKLHFLEQLEIAKIKGVIVASLLDRINYTFFKRISSKILSDELQGTFARTSPLYFKHYRHPWEAYSVGSFSGGLDIRCPFDHDQIGAAVALPNDIKELSNA